jgi:hypothetical protein
MCWRTLWTAPGHILSKADDKNKRETRCQ